MGRLSVAIMAHPSRARFVEELQSQLPGAEIVWDRAGSRWDTGSRAQRAHDPSADWHLVVQDDAILCRDFLPGVEAALEHVPKVPVSFYTGRTRPYAVEVLKSIARTQQKGCTWLAMRGPLWGVGIALPVPLIKPMLTACANVPIPNYDMRMSEHFDEEGLECWYSIPSLVDHRVGSENPSLVAGRKATAKRTAHVFLGDRSALDIDWGSDVYRAGDPTQPWRRTTNQTYRCATCPEVSEDLAGIVRHVGEQHDFGPVDFLATTPGAIRQLSRLREGLPSELRGIMWVIGVEFGKYAETEHQAIHRRSARKVLSRLPERFTITGTMHNFRFLGGRSAWAVGEGQGN